VEWQVRKRYLDRIVVRSGGRVVFLRVDELDWVESAGNYVRLHAAGEEYLHRESSQSWWSKGAPLRRGHRDDPG
jgi:two-component system LytT family response regulator